jgi:hypothetical protein
MKGIGGNQPTTHKKMPTMIDDGNEPFQTHSFGCNLWQEQVKETSFSSFENIVRKKLNWCNCHNTVDLLE